MPKNQLAFFTPSSANLPSFKEFLLDSREHGPVRALLLRPHAPPPPSEGGGGEGPLHHIKGALSQGNQQNSVWLDEGGHLGY